MRFVTVVCGMALALVSASASFSGASAQTPQSITTPDTVETRIGTLKFKDGVPSPETATAIYDNLDFTYAFRAFTDTFQGVSVEAIRRGLVSVGIKDNEIVLFSKLMDADSIFLTANADTVY